MTKRTLSKYRNKNYTFSNCKHVIKRIVFVRNFNVAAKRTLHISSQIIILCMEYGIAARV